MGLMSTIWPFLGWTMVSFLFSFYFFVFWWQRALSFPQRSSSSCWKKLGKSIEMLIRWKLLWPLMWKLLIGLYLIFGCSSSLFKHWEAGRCYLCGIRHKNYMTWLQKVMVHQGNRKHDLRPSHFMSLVGPENEIRKIFTYLPWWLYLCFRLGPS